MDTDVDLLTVMAEVGIALTGFTGLVVVLGRRARGDWTTAERTQLTILLQTSLAAVFFALLPLLTPRLPFPETAVWRALAGILSIACSAMTVSNWLPIIAASKAFPRSWRLLTYLSTVIMLSLVASGFVVAFGGLAEHRALIYLLTVGFLLCLAGGNFAFLLTPMAR